MIKAGPRARAVGNSGFSLLQFGQSGLDAFHLVLHLCDLLLVALRVHRDAVDLHGRLRKLGLHILFEGVHSFVHLTHCKGEFPSEEVPDGI